MRDGTCGSKSSTLPPFSDCDTLQTLPTPSFPKPPQHDHLPVRPANLPEHALVQSATPEQRLRVRVCAARGTGGRDQLPQPEVLRARALTAAAASPPGVHSHGNGRHQASQPAATRRVRPQGRPGRVTGVRPLPDEARRPGPMARLSAPAGAGAAQNHEVAHLRCGKHASTASALRPFLYHPSY